LCFLCLFVAILSFAFGYSNRYGAAVIAR
jgi:hypothetical protein